MADFTLIIGAVAEHLLGEPNRALSTRRELRFRSKGSMAIDLEKGTWYDWEVGEGGGVVDLVRRELALPGRDDAVAWLTAERYLDDRPPPKKTPVKIKILTDGKFKFKFAMATWGSSAAAEGTPVEMYLASRGITMSPIPRRLRFAEALLHKSGSRWPAMVGLVTDGLTDQPLAVHRTFLAKKDPGKAPVEPNKMALGRWLGGAVKLAPPAAHILVGEGIETCLAAMQATGVGAWAALSTSGLKRLELPPEVRRVTVLADHDFLNPKTGTRPGVDAARSAGARWRRQGRDARIAWPPEGKDFADMLVERT